MQPHTLLLIALSSALSALAYHDAQNLSAPPAPPTPAVPSTLHTSSTRPVPLAPRETGAWSMCSPSRLRPLQPWEYKRCVYRCGELCEDQTSKQARDGFLKALQQAGKNCYAGGREAITCIKDKTFPEDCHEFKWFCGNSEWGGASREWGVDEEPHFWDESLLSSDGEQD